MNTNKLKSFICGLLIGGIVLSGVNIYANNKKEESNKNIEQAIECINYSLKEKLVNKATECNTRSVAYSNIAIYEELHEMNNKLDKLIK